MAFIFFQLRKIILYLGIIYRFEVRVGSRFVRKKKKSSSYTKDQDKTVRWSTIQMIRQTSNIYRPHITIAPIKTKKKISHHVFLSRLLSSSLDLFSLSLFSFLLHTFLSSSPSLIFLQFWWLFGNELMGS